MSLKWYQRTDDGEIAEMVQRVAVMHSPSNPGTDGLVTNAEEGSVGRSQIRVDDPDGTFSIRGHRRVMAKETEAADDDFQGLVWFGFSFTQAIEEGSPFDGVGRVWTVDLDDLNTAFERRIMNSGANRPAETDVERIQWLLTTSQANLIDDDTLVSTDDPVDMDACDYRGQKLRDVFDDCAQQSGKNWYLVHLGIDAGDDVLFSPWYGHGTLDTFVSGVTITNDAAAVAADETGMLYVPSVGTKLKRDPSRVFSGVWMDYDGGDVFVTRPATATAFAIAGRDTNSQAMNVKTATKAIARANKYLGSIKTQEDIIETAIVVPASKVNAVVHGHLVDVQISWMPDYNVLTTGRILNKTARQIGTSTYELALEIAVEPPPATCPDGEYEITPSQHFAPLGSGTSDAEGLVWYGSGGSPLGEPLPNHAGFLSFPEYNGPAGPDFGAACQNNAMHFVLVGGGLLEIETAIYHTNPHLTVGWSLRHYDPVTGASFEDTGEVASGDPISITIPADDSENCVHVVALFSGSGPCGEKYGWAGADWTADE